MSKYNGTIGFLQGIGGGGGGGGGSSTLLNYKGIYNSSTNTPTLVNGVGTTGDWYYVTVAGSNNPTGANIPVGDGIAYDGSVWQRIVLSGAYDTDDIIVSGAYVIINGQIVAVGQSVTVALGALQGQLSALGTASLQNVGTDTGNVPQLGANGLPAVGGSLLTGLTKTQVGLSNVQNVDTTNSANVTIQSAFSPQSGAIAAGDNVLLALEKLQYQVSSGSLNYYANYSALPSSYPDFSFAIVQNTTTVSSITYPAGIWQYVSSAWVYVGLVIDNSTVIFNSSQQLAVNVGTGANQILQLTSLSKIPAVDGSLVTNLNASNLASGTVPNTRTSVSTVTPVNSVISNNDSLNTLANKTQGQLNNKQNLISSPTSGNLVATNSSGQTTDSGISSVTPIFAKTSLISSSNQLTLGVAPNTTILNSPSTLTVPRVVTFPNANSTTVQPQASATTNKVVQYIDAQGGQNLTQLGFSALSGNIAVEQLPNGGVNSANELLQLNNVGKIPAVDASLVTGVTGALTSTANNLNIAINGGTPSANVQIVNTNALNLAGTGLTSTVNGVVSNTVNVIPPIATPTVGGIAGVGIGGIATDTGVKISTSVGTDNTTIPTSLAVQSYVGSAVVGSRSFRGGYDASSNLFPTTGGTGAAGSILKGDEWVITVAGTLGGEPVIPGNSITALVDNPAQTAADWFIVDASVDSVNGQTGDVSITVENLTDSLITSPTNRQVLGFNSTTDKWNNIQLFPSDIIANISTPQTANFTASINTQYAVNSTSGAFTVTLPTSNIANNSQIVLFDSGGAAGTNNITISNGSSTVTTMANNGQYLILAYNTAAGAWLPISQMNFNSFGFAFTNPVPSSTIPAANQVVNWGFITSQYAQLAPFNALEVYVNGVTGSDISGKGTIFSPFATLTKALTVVGGSGTILTDTATYSNPLTINNKSNILVTTQTNGNFWNYKVTQTKNVTISGTSTRISFQGIQFNTVYEESVTHLTNQGILNFQNCGFVTPNPSIMTLGAYVTSNMFNYFNYCDFTSCVETGGYINLANNTNNSFTANTTINTKIITGVSTNLSAGQFITGNGIPAGTIIISLVTAGTYIMSQAATSTNNGVTLYKANIYTINNSNGVRINIGVGNLIFAFNTSLGENGVTAALIGHTENYYVTSVPLITVVATYVDMLASNFTHFGGIGYMVHITSDSTATNNGLWQCIAYPFTNVASAWRQMTYDVPTNIAGGVLGSIPYQTAPNITGMIAPNATTALKVLSQTGTGSAGSLPVWISPPAPSSAALTEATSNILTITGGANAVLNATTIQVKQASTTQSGYISNTDWNTFNNKQATLTNPVTSSSTGVANRLAVYTGAGNVVSPTAVLPTSAVPAFTGAITNTQGSLSTSMSTVSSYLSSSVNFGISTSRQNVTGLNVTVPAGTWMITYHVFPFVNMQVAVNSGYIVSVYLNNGLSDIPAGNSFACYCWANVTGGPYVTGTGSASLIVTPSSTTTYAVQLQLNSTVSVGSFSAPSGSIVALRVS